MSIKRIESNGYLSKAVVHNGIAYIAGQTAADDSQDMAGQMDQVLSKIDEYLAAAGTDNTKLLTAMIYLSDMSKKNAMNDKWIAWLGAGNQPTRACVGTNLGTPGKLVEIVVSAAVE